MSELIYNEHAYVSSTTNKVERIRRLEQIVDNLILAQINNGFTSDSSGLEYYIVDDGQTKITTAYRTLTDIPKAIEGYMKLIETLKNQLGSRSIVLKDAQTFRCRR